MDILFSRGGHPVLKKYCHYWYQHLPKAVSKGGVRNLGGSEEFKCQFELNGAQHHGRRANFLAPNSKIQRGVGCTL